MKIAVVGTRGFPGLQGGVENHCEQLYIHLAENGCDITVFTRRPYLTTHLDNFKGIKLTPINCPRSKFLEAFVHTFRGILTARKLKPDILHIHAIGPSFFVPLARAFGMKVIVTHHGPDYKRKKWPLPAKMFLKFCEYAGMTFAHERIAIAGNIADDIKKKYGKDSWIIPNGVNMPVLLHTEDVLSRYNLERQRYILSVGRLVPEKGFDDLIAAFNHYSFDGWKLVIVGDADHQDRYSYELKMKANKNKNIVLTGFLTGQPLYEIYQHAGLFVLPSHHEGLPIVLLEAMSYGLSCIASDIPANRNVELAADRFFRAGDEVMLSQKIADFIQRPWGDADRRCQLAMIAEKYNWKSIAEETLKVYRKALNIEKRK